MSISPADYATYRRTARRRAQTAITRWAARREQAWEAARRAAAYVRERCPGVTVRVFGSLLYEDSFGLQSDIDLAVEGIAWPDYLRVWSALEKREPEFRIDLVDTAIVSDSLRAQIEREGVLV